MLKTGIFYLAILSVIAGFMSASISVHAEDSAELKEFKKAIRAKYDIMEKGWATDNAALIYDQFYSKDARGLAANEPRSYKGREQMKVMWDDVVLRGETRVVSVESYVNGDAGWDWANLYTTYNQRQEDAEPFSVMYLFLWSKENGEWMCKGDMYVVGEFTPENIKGQLYSDYLKSKGSSH